MLYRKKHIVIEAVRFDGTDTSCDWLLPQLMNGSIGRGSRTLGIKTPEGVNGEFYPCKPDIFEKTYEAVD